jgi:alkylation response protein AidB-like acyl-CoA dehydrogenase
LEAAKALVHRDLAETHSLARRGEPITVDRRIRNRLTQAHAAEQAVHGVEIIYRATGGAGLYLSERIQRAWRDIHAASHHASLNWDAVSSMYGQHVLGLEPKGRY